MELEDAEEYTQALGQVVAGGWRQVALGERLGVPQALGLSTKDWVTERLGGYVRLSAPERKDAATELAGDGMTQRQIAGVLGVGAGTVARDLAPEPAPNGAPEPVDEVPDQLPAPEPAPNGAPEPVEVEPTIDPESEVTPRSSGTESTIADREGERRRAAEADRRVRHTQSFARSVVALWSLLDPDPVAFLGHTWDPDANPHRSTSASEAFTANGLRLIADRLSVLADRAEQSGGHL